MPGDKREFRHDVIVLESDLLWGGMEGVLAELREDFYLSQVPIILASMCHSELDARKHPMIVAINCDWKSYRYKPT